MNRIITCLFAFALCLSVTAEEENMLNTIISLGMPTLIINTIDNEEPTCDYIEAPEGCMGVGRVNDNKVYGSLVIVQGKDTLYNSGDYVEDISGISIRITGNTSGRYSDVPPYKLKLEKKADLLNRNNAIYNDKDWRLIKETVGVYNIAGLKLSQLIGMAWTPQYKHINFILNGKYRGVYLLIEPVKRNSDCRIDVAKNGGYIVERDAYWWNEALSFPSPFYAKDLSYRWTFKYPDDKDVTEDNIEYIKGYMERAEEALFDDTTTSNYDQYFDLKSMAKWLMVHDILGTRDSGGSNMFFSKYDSSDASLLTMPVVWDFDSSFDIDSKSFSRIHTSGHGYFKFLLNSNNHSFRTEYKELWKRVDGQVLIDNLENYIDSFCASDEGQAVKKSRNFSIAQGIQDVTSLEQDVIKAKEWLNAHKLWLNGEINKIPDVNAINDITTPASSSSKAYTLTGQQLSPVHHSPAIVIKNGKKFVKF